MIALLADGFRSLQGQSDAVLLLRLFAANGFLSALLALAVVYRLPYRGRRQALLLWGMLTLFGLFIPLFGTLGAGASMLAGMRWRETVDRRDYGSLGLPQFDPFGRKEGSSFDRGGLRSRIEGASVPAETRLQSIAALQNMPTVAATPILRTLLDDQVEDIRLVAFGMLDKEEKKIAERIHHIHTSPEPTSERGRYTRAKQLAELYWELAYSGVVHGDLRRYTLGNALSQAETALAIDGDDAGLRFLTARILDALGSHEDAEMNMILAVALGMPEFRALPYLAEFAFERADFRLTRKLLLEMAELPVTPRVQPMVDYWKRYEHAL